MASQVPRLAIGPLDNRIYVVTRYKERRFGVVEAREKFDVTDQLGHLLEQMKEQGIELVPDTETQP